nr:glucose-6-phosphatase 2 [Penaeus vannamei]
MEAYTEMSHKWGAEFIESLQTSLPGRGRMFMQISDIGDPGLAFTLYFPVVVALHAGVGVRLMWSIIFCEWSNMILKWCIAGDRPYWWVHETPVYAHRRPPVLMQYPRTCETGPGMPSGHAKLNAAMFYILVSAFNEMVVKNTTLLSQKQRAWASRGLWASYAIWMMLVLVSRTYIAAHFPHQCVAGALIGLMMAMMVSRMPVLQHLSRRQYVALSVTIIVSVLGIYFSVRTIGGNVLWSLEKAIKWCVKREYIHIDSTPFYSFSRYSGVSLGLGLGLSSSWFKKAAKSRFSTNMIVSLAVLNFVTSQIGVVVHKSLSPAMFGWYVAEFTLNCTVTFMLVAALPNFVRVVYSARAGDKGKKK